MKIGDLATKTLEEDWQQEEEDHVRPLRQRHPRGHALPLQLGEIDTHHHEVKVERDADEKHARDKDGEGRLAHECERVETEHCVKAHVRTGLLRRRAREREREETEED
jgi:hypothetical protein